MADGIIKRFVSVIFDRASAKKVEGELQDSLESAGKKGGTGFLRELKAAFDRRMADLKVALNKGLISPADFKKQGALAAKQFNVGVIKGMEDARKAGNLTDKEFLKLSRSLKKVGDDGAHAGGRVGGAFLKAAAAFAAFFTIDRAIRFFKESITEALEAEKSVQRLDSVLRPLGITYQQVNREVEDYFETLQKTTRFSDDDARDAFANLITATGDYRLSLKLLDVTAKIAEKRQTTMAEAAQTAADASKGLTRGMKDLGISTGETGDIVGKIDTALGDLARDGLKTTSGQLQNARNLWKEFQEQIGTAIIGSDKLTDSLGPKGLRGALISLNDWAKDHSKDISGFVDTLVSAAEKIAKLSAFIMKVHPSFRAARTVVRELGSEANEAATDTGNFLRFKGTPTGSRTPAQTAAEIEAEKRLRREAEQDRKKKAKELADLLEKYETDLAVVKLQIEKGITEQLAREQVTREQKHAGHIAKQVASAKEVEEAWLRVVAARAMLESDTSNLLPKLSSTEKPVPTIAGVASDAAGTPLPQSRPLEFVDRGLALNPKDVERQSQLAAEAYVSPWQKALDAIEAEAEKKHGLFTELGQAWAEGGLAGLAQLAASKVKENIAQAIEWAAKGLGFAVVGRPDAAAGAAATAAKHVAAAAAWKLVGGASGGGGAGGGASASGEANENRAPNLRGGNVQPVGTEVHLYLSDRIGALVDDVEFQRASLAAMEKARERWGDQARIYVHRGSK